MVQEKESVVIIGAGISGLTSGIYALRAGYRVCIYDCQHQVGGMCAKWKRQGIDCTTAVHWLMGARNGSDLNGLWQEIDAFNENNCHRLDYLSAIPNGADYIFLYSDIDKLYDELLDLSPQDEDDIRALIVEIKKYQKLPIPANRPIELMEPMEKALFFAPYIRIRKMTSIKEMSIGEYVRRFKSAQIRRLLLSVLPDPRMDVCQLMVWLASNANGDIGFPVGGFPAMINRIYEKYKAMGGELQLDAEVKNILISDEEVKGVVLQDGTEITADKVISTVSPDVLLCDLLEGQYHDGYFDKEFELYQQKRHYAPALTFLNLQVKTALSHLPHTLVIEPKNLSAFGSKIDNLKINHFCFDGEIDGVKENLLQVVWQDGNYRQWKDLKEYSAEKYQEAKRGLALQAITEIESVYPSLQGKIELLDIATPLTIKRYCHSYCGSYLSFFELTDYGQMENHSGTIEGVQDLYLAGQWVFQYGGLPMAAISGKFAVQRVMNRKSIE